MNVVMKLVELASGQPTVDDDRYLKACDFEFDDGRGLIETTDKIEEAMRFESFIDAMEYWRTSPANHPTRLTDGKPNRPLTAYTVQIVSVP